MVMFARTSGSLGNNGGSKLLVQYPGDSTVQGVTQGAIGGAADEKPASFYRATAPYIRRSGNQAVTPSDFKAIALAYPGVASVSVKAQRDMAPQDPRWANVVQICVLPTAADTFTEFQWTGFKSYMNARAYAGTMLRCLDPTKIPVAINVRCSIQANVVPAEIKAAVAANLRSLFTKNVNSLGHLIALSDLTAACRVPGVDYSEILTPRNDMTPLSELSWYSPSAIVVDIVMTSRTFK
jgi:hypothetical protein